MAGDRKSRFLKLERSRREVPPAAGAQGRPSRFEAVEQPGAKMPEASSSAATAGRFQDPAPSLDVESSGSARMPFIRCARCETDHGAHATRCQHCGADLDSPEQRAFNEELWRRRLEEKEREDAAVEALRQARAEADAAASLQRREAAALLAREVAAATRRRLDAEDDEDAARSWTRREGRALDLVTEWVRRSPTRARWAVLAGVVAVLAILLAAPGTRVLGIAAAAIGAVALLRIALR